MIQTIFKTFIWHESFEFGTLSHLLCLNSCSVDLTPLLQPATRGHQDILASPLGVPVSPSQNTDVCSDTQILTQLPSSSSWYCRFWKSSKVLLSQLTPPSPMGMSLSSNIFETSPSVLFTTHNAWWHCREPFKGQRLNQQVSSLKYL